MTTTTTGSTAREDRFTAAIGRLRTRVTGASIERWFRLAGPVLIPLGALMILLGWWGAANTTRIYLQIPYLISGGLLGLGCMFVGGFVYFARWLTDLLDAVRAQTRRAEEAKRRSVEALERIEALLRTAPSVEGDSLVATEHGRLVHRADCRLVVGRSTHVVGPAEAASSDVCRICRPEPLEV